MLAVMATVTHHLERHQNHLADEFLDVPVGMILIVFRQKDKPTLGVTIPQTGNSGLYKWRKTLE